MSSSKQTLYAEVNTDEFKGVYEVEEFFGKRISLKINYRATDFKITEIVKFCNEDGETFGYKPQKYEKKDDY